MHEELIVDMVNEGIAFLPRDNKKYAGSVARVNKDGGNVAWLLKVKQSFVNYQKEFATEEEAYAKMHDINLRACLEIKNRFTVFEDHVVVQLSEGEEFICDPDDLHIVEDHIWRFNLNEEIITKLMGVTSYFVIWSLTMCQINEIPSIILTETVMAAAKLTWVYLIKGDKILIVLFKRTTDLGLLEFITIYKKIFGMQRGLMRTGNLVRTSLSLAESSFSLPFPSHSMDSACSAILSSLTH